MRSNFLAPSYGRLLLCLASAYLLAATEPLHADDAPGAPAADGWVNLLPKNQLATHWSTRGNWSIDDTGVVTLTPREGEKGWTRYDSYLWLEGQYTEFEIQFEYMVEERGNSGFYFHVGDKADPVARGIEVQIYDSGSKGADAKLTDHDSGGVIPGIPPKKNTAKPAGEWNHFHITVVDRTLTVKLNGEVVNEVHLDEHPRLKDRPKTGAIGFQDHALPLKLRNIRLKKLS